MAGANGADTAAPNKRARKASPPPAARKPLPELVKRAERVLHGKAARLKGPSREASIRASEQLETARNYVVERVQERPFTTTLAVLGAGVLVGLLFAGRRR